MKKVELLAPAGNITCLKAAINAGADAIYVGANKFSARAFADNLSDEEIIDAIRICHIHGVKLFVACNILLKDYELNEAVQMIKSFYEAGLDGVIIQDYGLADVLRKCCPKLALHGSTQMSIMSSHGAEYIKNKGFSRVVPARELSLEEVIKIKKDTGMEIECFIHGAMCYSYSGLCLMSSMIGARSGNRGKCAGTCRLPFSYNMTSNGKEEYPLSMKDMCTISIIPKLIEAGIDSFKIEGRMKSPEYVAGVTSLYRKYIDMYLSNPTDYRVADSDMNKLRGLYMRTDICEGYYEYSKENSMVTLGLPGYSGNDKDFIDKINEQYVRKNKHIKINAFIYAHVGEEIVLSFNTDSAYASVTGAIVSEAQKSPVGIDRIKGQISKLGDTQFEIDGFDYDISENLFIPMSELNDIRRRCVSLLEDNIINNNGFVLLNDSLEIYEDTTTSYCDYTKIDSDINDGLNIIDENRINKFSKDIDIYVTSKEQLIALNDFEVARIYLDHNLFYELITKNIIEEYINNPKAEYIISLPKIYRFKSEKYFVSLIDSIKECINKNVINIYGVMVHGLDEYHLIRELFKDICIFTDNSVYLFNKHSIHFLTDKNEYPDGVTLSYEHNSKEIHDISNWLSGCQIETSLVIYGRIPMMISAGCIKNTYHKCDSKICTDSTHILTDRKNSKFPVRTDCSICTNIIYNDRPLSLYNMLEKLNKSKVARYRMDFTVECADEVKNILVAYLSKNKRDIYDENSLNADNYIKNIDYTNGHFKRGV